MKILMLNTYDLRGGAARATWRLFRGLRDLGQDAELLVQEKRSDDPNVIRADSPVSGALNPFRPYLDFAVPLLQTRRRVLFSTALIPDKLESVIERINPDVVHLNWITGGFIRLETLAAIRCPVVWTLHDMWAFTGGCHNTVECKRYMDGCGKCPLLHSSRENDLSSRVFHRKAATYRQMENLVVTAPGNWLADQVRSSKLLGDRRIEVIFNGMDTSEFQPVDKNIARKRLNLPEGKKIIAFGAIRATETHLKGFHLLVEALKILNDSEYLLVVFGSDGPGKVDTGGLDVVYKGHVADHKTLTDIYAAAGLVAVPSYQEVFGQAASEAMACGTPVVAFGCTGLLDIVKHKETGYLADPFKPESLAEGIGWIFEDDQRRRALGIAARKRAVDCFDAKGIAGKFINLYREVIDGKRR